MLINTFPIDNYFFKDGVRFLLGEIQEEVIDTDYCLFVLIDRFSIGRLISERIIEMTFHNRVFLLTHEKYLPLALYYVNAFPGKVNLLSKKTLKKNGETFHYLTTSLEHSPYILPITPGEYGALEISLKDIMKCTSLKIKKRKTFYCQRWVALQKMGLRKINALLI